MIKKVQQINSAYILALCFISIFLLPLPTHAAYRNTVQAEGTLLYYWPMDEAAGATSLAAAVGSTAITLHGATAGASGKTDGTAVSFNGTSNYGITASTISGYTDKVVVEALVYFDNYDTAGTLMGWELHADMNVITTGFLFSPKYGDAPDNTFTLSLKGSGYNTANYTQASAGTWHHVVTVYDKGQATNEVDLYIDGTLQTATSRPDTTNNTNWFGNKYLYLMSRSGTSMFTPGKMQHLAIYTNLTSDRILAHAQGSGVRDPIAGTLSESSHTGTTATVSWTNATSGNGAITTQLQRSPTGAGTWADVGGATASPVTDTGLSYSTGYDYRVAYTDQTPVTAYSNTLTVTTDDVVTHTITASAGTHGAISPSGATTVNNGSDQAFTITADAGYRISGVVVDNSSVGVVSSYTFNTVTADHTISATFSAVKRSGVGGCYDCYVPIIPITPSGGITVNINSGVLAISKYLRYKQTNNDVKRLQIFLNSDPDTHIADSGAGSPGKETNYFGLLTHRAVIKFQEKYAKDVLDPWGLKKGTGYVGKTTLAKINELMKNKGY